MMAETPVFMRLWRPEHFSGSIDPVGETKKQAFHFSFCSSLKVDFQGTQVTSDAGLLLVRELDERLGLGQLIRENLTDARRGKMTRLSCHRFRGNEVRLWLSILAYNLGNLLRRLALPGGIEDWSLTSMQQRLVKTGGRLVKHARYYWLMLAEGHLTHERFAAVLRRIAMLPLTAS
jgi:Transposase DDE domain group 1